MSILKFKEFTLYNLVAAKATSSAFCCLKIDLFVEKFVVGLLQSIDECILKVC